MDMLVKGMGYGMLVFDAIASCAGGLIVLGSFLFFVREMCDHIGERFHKNDDEEA